MDHTNRKQWMKQGGPLHLLDILIPILIMIITFYMTKVDIKYPLV